MLVIIAISASVDSQKEIDNDIDEIANKASPKMHPQLFVVRTRLRK